MSTFSPLLIPQFVLKDWQAALDAGEPRALELAFALNLALPAGQLTELIKIKKQIPIELDAAMRELLDSAHTRYDAFVDGTCTRIDMLNPSVFAFERNKGDERLLIVNNLARVSQPVKFGSYAGRAGWDLLNRVEFQFPARAQMEAYEFLWLLVD